MISTRSHEDNNIERFAFLKKRTREVDNPEEFAAISKHITTMAVLVKFRDDRLDPHLTSTIR